MKILTNKINDLITRYGIALLAICCLFPIALIGKLTYTNTKAKERIIRDYGFNPQKCYEISWTQLNCYELKREPYFSQFLQKNGYKVKGYIYRFHNVGEEHTYFTKTEINEFQY